jgi:PAS domain S-box-containing protein
VIEYDSISGMRASLRRDSEESHLSSRTSNASANTSTEELSREVRQLRQHRAVLEKQIEELRHDNEVLKESESRYRAILRAIPDMVFIYSGDGYCLDVHVHDFGALAAEPESFLGRHMGEVLPRPLTERFQRHFDQALRTGKGQVLEYSLEVPGGQRRFEARITQVDDERILAIVRDTTERSRSGP